MSIDKKLHEQIKNEMRKGVTGILTEVARQNGVTVFEVRTEIQKAIDEMWNDKATAKQKAYRDKMFPDGKPTIEAFILQASYTVKMEFEK